MNWANVAAFVVIVAGFVLLRHWAARRVARGDGRAAWLLFGLPLVGFAVVIWAGVQLLATNPLLGIGFLAGGLILAGALVLAIRRASVGISEASTPDDRVSGILEAFQGYQVLLAFVILFGGLVAVVALIAVLVITR